jgi:OOP family OmpA-OmpF porin
MKYRALLATMAMATSFAGANSAQAGAEVGSWYLVPKAVYVDPDRLQRAFDGATSHKVGDAFGASFGVGKVLNQNWDGEVNYVYSVHGAGSSSAATSYKSWEGILNRVYMRDKKVNPFVGFGINSTTYSLTTQSSITQQTTHREFGYLVKTGLIVDVNLGSLNDLPRIHSDAIQLVIEMGWRADGGLKGTDKINLGEIRNLENTFLGLGLHYKFGKHTVAQVAPVAVAATVVETSPPAQSTPVPAPADTDRDGVVDPSDRCANTPVGDKVDVYGCSLTMPLEVRFDTDKATIKPEYNPKLEEFVEFLKNVPSVKGTLEGHTDNIGSKSYNHALSERRAEAVKADVVSKGVDAARLETKGYGEESPIADNDTAEGRAANRRVEFIH